MNEFIEKYKDSIICEPSGRTLSDVKNQTIQKVFIIRKDGEIE
jgi:hypothetical protein